MIKKILRHFPKLYGLLGKIKDYFLEKYFFLRCNIRSIKKKKYFFSVGAIFKNESHAIVEWIEHYLSQGVGHFYLIDNGSTDDYYEKIKPYIDKGLIDLYINPSKHAQVKLYNKYFKKVNSEWLGVFDLDEFTYTQHYKTIKEMLENKKEISQIIGIWLDFGSNEHVKQPTSIVKGFTKRKKYDNNLTWVKSIVKMNHVKNFDVHVHNIFGKSFPFEPNSQVQAFELDETLIKNFDCIINHYRVQSFDFFKKNKIKRGSVRMSKNDIIKKSFDYFKKYDKNEVEDFTLVNIIKNANREEKV